MTLQELYSFCSYAYRNAICARSAYNGKILCKTFSPAKHAKLAQREVKSIWAEIRPFGSSQSARAILCCYVDGYEEYEKALGERQK